MLVTQVNAARSLTPVLCVPTNHSAFVRDLPFCRGCTDAFAFQTDIQAALGLPKTTTLLPRMRLFLHAELATFLGRAVTAGEGGITEDQAIDLWRAGVASGGILDLWLDREGMKNAARLNTALANILPDDAPAVVGPVVIAAANITDALGFRRGAGDCTLLQL